MTRKRSLLSKLNRMKTFNHTDTGMVAEMLVYEKLRRRYHLRTPPRGEGDLQAVDRKTGVITDLEIKGSRRGQDGYWRVTLWKANHTSHRRADYVVLVMLMRPRPVYFLIPVAVVRDIHHIAMRNPRAYAGRFAKYRVTRLVLE